MNDRQAEQFQHFRGLLGKATFQRIQHAVWKQFSSEPPPINREGNLTAFGLGKIWDALIQAFRDEAEATREGESASKPLPQVHVLWELQKDGVEWSATLKCWNDRDGWEVVLTRNGRLSDRQRFVNRDSAEAWADEKCIEIAMGT